MGQTRNTRRALDVAAVNAGLLDAEKSISQARGALGGADSGTALNRLAHALAGITRAMQDIRGERPRFYDAGGVKVTVPENEQ